MLEINIRQDAVFSEINHVWLNDPKGKVMSRVFHGSRKECKVVELFLKDLTQATLRTIMIEKGLINYGQTY